MTSRNRLKAVSVPLLVFLSGVLGPRILLYREALLGIVPAPPPFLTESLGTRLWDYVSFTTLKPPVTYLLLALPVHLLGAEDALRTHAFLAQTMVMDVAAVALVYLSARLFSAKPWWALASALVFSTALLPLELWRDGSHYDNHTPLFVAAFLYASLWCFRRPDIPRAIALSVAGALLWGQSAVFVVVIVAGLALVFLALASCRTPRLLLVGLIACVGPIAMAATLANRTVSGAGLAPSHLAGGTMSMVVRLMTNNDATAKRRILEEAGAPAWYLWCYDNAIPARDEHGNVYDDWILAARDFGVCFDLLPPGGEYWPSDFSQLRQYLGESGQETLLRIVEEDANDARDRQYRFAGYAPEFTPRWIGVYGAISSQVFKHAVRTHPREFLRVVGRMQISWLTGYKWPYQISAKTLENWPILRRVIKSFGIFAVALYLSAMIAAPIAAYRAMAVIYRNLLKTRKSNENDLNAYACAALILLPIAMLAAIFCTIVGGDQDRYFQQILPFLAVWQAAGPLLLRDFILSWRRDPAASA